MRLQMRPGLPTNPDHDTRTFQKSDHELFLSDTIDGAWLAELAQSDRSAGSVIVQNQYDRRSRIKAFDLWDEAALSRRPSRAALQMRDVPNSVETFVNTIA